MKQFVLALGLALASCTPAFAQDACDQPLSDLREKVAAPPADVMAQLNSSAAREVIEDPTFDIYLISGPGVGEKAVIVVFVQNGCVVMMRKMDMHDFQTFLEKHRF